ncbi:MAG TPA: transcription termination factor Rho [Nocardioidaceae bacterium]|nr:transcription termination factor Rho [Nocardioidaceae bacterium]
MTQTPEATAPAVARAATRKKSGGLNSMLLPELKQLAGTLGIKGASTMRKSALIEAISARQTGSPGTAPSSTSFAATSAEPANAPSAPASPSREPAATSPAASLSEPAGSEPATAPFSTDEMNGNFDSSSTSTPATSDTDGGTSGPSEPASEADSAPATSAQSSDARPDRTRNESARNRNRDSQSRSDSGASQSRTDSSSAQGRGDSSSTQGRGDNGSSQPSRSDNRDSQHGRSESSTQQSRSDNRDSQQGRSESSTQQSRDGSSSPGRDSYRDDDRGGSRNSRRRNRNRDRYRDRDKRRDGNDAEPQVGEDDVLIPAAGILDLLDNYAFVRTTGYLPGPNDVYVALSMVRKYGLRKGDAITGAVRQQSTDSERREKFNPMVRIDTVNGAEPEAARHRIEFSKLTPLYAAERLRLETEPHIVATRIIDIVAPIGKGQRGLIVSPSKAGKTLILQAMANAITTNNPECHLMVVLVDERPEEVTDMQRAVKGEVIASTFDRPAEDHTTVAELAIERAKRLVELGHDVIVLLDSITRLGRAYNLAAPASGRILSGGVDSSALYPPKRFFGAARNIEDGGSLTILATALIETGSKMDEVIFEEFKGTGNMELRLRREYADKRIFPAIDVDASGTRREDLLMSKDELQIVWKLRRVLSALDGQQALELLLEKLRQTKSNVEFLMQVNKTTPTASGLRGSGDD